VPDTPARELFLPVNQISASVQLRPGLSIEAYDQLEWRHDRLPGVGSYFSTADILGAGGERIIAAPGQFLYRAPDQQPGAWGQFGATLRATVGDADLGLYALRYNTRSPVVTTAAGGTQLSGDRAFALHDTYGFPIDLTLEMAAEQGLTVDETGFRTLMAEQRQRAKADNAAKKSAGADVSVYREILDRAGPTTFTGYGGYEHASMYMCGYCQ